MVKTGKALSHCLGCVEFIDWMHQEPNDNAAGLAGSENVRAVFAELRCSLKGVPFVYHSPLEIPRWEQTLRYLNNPESHISTQVPFLIDFPVVNQPFASICHEFCYAAFFMVKSTSKLKDLVWPGWLSQLSSSPIPCRTLC